MVESASDATPWTNIGLTTLTNSNLRSASLKNVAFLLEGNLQVNGVDRKFSSRTSGQNKLVNLPFPRRNTLFPVIALSYTRGDGRGLGKGHAMVIYDITIEIFDQKTVHVDQLYDQMLPVMLADANRETLVTKDQNWHSTNYLVNTSETTQDATKDNVFVASATFRFFTLINS